MPRKLLMVPIFAACAVGLMASDAAAWPWSDDQVNQRSIKPQEKTTPYPSRSVPVTGIYDQVADREEADGLDLTWGNGETILALIHKVAHREGFGETGNTLDEYMPTCDESHEHAVDQLALTNNSFANLRPYLVKPSAGIGNDLLRFVFLHLIFLAGDNNWSRSIVGIFANVAVGEITPQYRGSFVAGTQVEGDFDPVRMCGIRAVVSIQLRLFHVVENKLLFLRIE